MPEFATLPVRKPKKKNKKRYKCDETVQLSLVTVTVIDMQSNSVFTNLRNGSF